MRKAVRVESVLGGEPDSEPEVKAGVREPSQISAWGGRPGAPRAWPWTCTVAGRRGPSVGGVTPQTCYSRNFDARKPLESFLGLVPRVQGGKCPWVTDSRFREARSWWPHVCAEKEGADVCTGLTPPSGSQGVRAFSPNFVGSCWVCGQRADPGFCSKSSMRSRRAKPGTLAAAG